MHVFGAIPEGERLAEFVYAVVRYEKGPGSLRGLVALALGPGAPGAESAFAERVDAAARRLCIAYLVQGMPLAEGLAALGGSTRPDPQVVKAAQAAIDDVRQRTLLSDEMEALLGGIPGGLRPAGTVGPPHPGPTGHLAHRPQLLLPGSSQDPVAGGLADRGGAGRADTGEVPARDGRLSGERRVLLAVHGHHVGGRRGDGPDAPSAGGHPRLAVERPGAERHGGSPGGAGAAPGRHHGAGVRDPAGLLSLAPSIWWTRPCRRWRPGPSRPP